MTDPLADFLAERPATSGPCKMARILAELDEQRKDALATVLKEPARVQSNASISRVVTRWGHPVSDQSVREHRLGNCMCHRTP